MNNTPAGTLKASTLFFVGLLVNFIYFFFASIIMPSIPMNEAIIALYFAINLSIFLVAHLSLKKIVKVRSFLMGHITGGLVTATIYLIGLITYISTTEGLEIFENSQLKTHSTDQYCHFVSIIPGDDITIKHYERESIFYFFTYLQIKSFGNRYSVVKAEISNSDYKVKSLNDVLIKIKKKQKQYHISGVIKCTRFHPKQKKFIDDDWYLINIDSKAKAKVK